MYVSRCQLIGRRLCTAVTFVASRREACQSGACWPLRGLGSVKAEHRSGGTEGRTQRRRRRTVWRHFGRPVQRDGNEDVQSVRPKLPDCLATHVDEVFHMLIDSKHDKLYYVKQKQCINHSISNFAQPSTRVTGKTISKILVIFNQLVHGNTIHYT
jgi:hypothetical protein